MLQLVTTPTHADPEDMGAYGIHPAYSLEQTHMRVSSSENGGTPIAGWFLLGEIPLKGMMNRGTPMT